MANEKYTIGYVDEESQWVNKFLLTLSDEFNIVTFQLDEDTTLAGLLIKIFEANLDCLVVDYELTETAIIPFNGDEIVSEIRKIRPYFPLFIITSKDEEYVLHHVEDNEIVRLKDELTERPQILTQRIVNKISNYYHDIETAQQIIKSLSEKKLAGQQLTGDEEEKLFQQYLFLEKVFPEDKTFPDVLTNPSTVDALAGLIQQTKEVLEELKKQNG